MEEHRHSNGRRGGRGGGRGGGRSNRQVSNVNRQRLVDIFEASDSRTHP